MLEQQHRAIIKHLLTIARADGEISPEEKALLQQIFIEAGLVDDKSISLDKLIESIDSKDTADVSLSELEEEARLNIMRALLIMSFIDGKLSFSEFTQIEKYQVELALSTSQMDTLRIEATAAAEAINKGND